MSEVKPESSLMKILSFTADKTMELANANSVVGDSIQIDGVTVIPISKMSVGFAGGGADIADANKKKKQNPAGAGAKVTLTPLSFLIVSDGKAEVVSVSAEEGGSTGIADAISTAIKKFKEKKPKDKDDKKED